MFGSRPGRADQAPRRPEREPIPQDLRAIGLDDIPGLPNLSKHSASEPDTEPEVEVAEDDDCMILYTSGTTGLAMGALFDHHRMLWVGHSVTTLGVTTRDRLLHVAPSTTVRSWSSSC